jgi:hypothetical protein
LLTSPDMWLLLRHKALPGHRATSRSRPCLMLDVYWSSVPGEVGLQLHVMGHASRTNVTHSCLVQGSVMQADGGVCDADLCLLILSALLAALDLHSWRTDRQYQYQ